MLGLPFSDNIRCRLLLGLSISAASCSNPMVALTRSRSRSRAVCGSPLRNRVAASSSNARANAGSRCTRATTVCLKSRVRAISLTFAPARLVGHVAAERLGEQAVETQLCAFAEGRQANGHALVPGLGRRPV